MSLLPDLRFYYQQGAKSQYLIYAPDGWDEQMIKWERNKKYYGMFRSFTIPLKFVKDGAEALRRTFYEDGFSSDAQLTVEALDHESLEYYDAYNGVFDFSTFKDIDTNVEINLIDAGLVKLIKDKESVEYSFTNWSFEEPDYIGNYPPGVYKIFWSPDHNVDYYDWFRCMTLENFAKLLIDKMVGGQLFDGTYGFDSSLLDSWKKAIMITNGRAIRYNATCRPPTMELTIYKTSFKDFFKSIDALFCIGFSVEVRNGVETFVLENRVYHYNANQIYDVGSVSNLKLAVYKDYNLKSIKAGYSDKDYDDKNYGWFEFNTESTFEAQNETTGDEYDILPKYRGDGRGIRQIIVNSDGTAWENDSSDDDIFFVHVENVTETDEDHGHAGDMADDKLRKVDDPDTEYDAYNCEISPRRNLGRHQGFIDSCMFGLSDKLLEFTSGLKDQSNNETQSSPIETWVGEYEGWTIGTTASQVMQWFKPIEISFEAVYTDDFSASLETNPRGIVAFKYLGNQYYGYVLSVETKLTGKGSQSIKLLSIKENDLENLIRS